MSSTGFDSHAGPVVEIDAPADVVWEILSDVPGWPGWASLYPSMGGSLKVGSYVHFTVAVPGMKQETGRALVTAVEPKRLIQYRTDAFLGLVRGDRHIEMRPIGRERTAVMNGERLKGAVGSLLARFIEPRIHAALATMNGELKRTAEARWAARKSA